MHLQMGVHINVNTQKINSYKSIGLATENLRANVSRLDWWCDHRHPKRCPGATFAASNSKTLTTQIASQKFWEAQGSDFTTLVNIQPVDFSWQIFVWRIFLPVKLGDVCFLPKKPGFTPCLDRLCSRWTRSQSVDQRFGGGAMFFCKCHENQDLYPSNSWFLEILVILFDSIWLSRSELTYTFSYPDPVPSPAFPRVFFYFWDPWPCRMRPRLESPNRQTYVPPSLYPAFCQGSGSRPNWKLQQQKTSFILRTHALKKTHKRHFKKKKGFQLLPFPFSKSLRFCFSSPGIFENDQKKSSKLWAHPSRRSKILTSFTVS